jgi:regulator of protease activity HflC (stomatin/prohibitin superfamily)
LLDAYDDNNCGVKNGLIRSGFLLGNKTIVFKGVLVDYEIGCGLVAILSIVSGIKYALFNVIQLGILLSLITILISFILHVNKCELLAETVKALPSDANDEKSQRNKEKTKKIDLVKYLQRYLEIYYPLQLIVIAITGIFIEFFIFKNLRNSPFPSGLLFLLGLLSLAISFLLMVSFNILKQNQEILGFKMLSYFFKAGQWIAFSCGLALVIKYLGYGRIEYWLGYVTVIFLVIIFTEIGMQGIMRLVDGKGNHSMELKLIVLSALLSGRNPVNQLLISLEEETGISLRSTWSIGFIRRNIFLITFMIVMFLWLMTSLIQVNPDEEGLMYSFGKMSNRQPLRPGIHLKLPWPIQTVKIYSVFKVKSFTVGYESNKKSDYLWTLSHGGEEYKLLLGDGKELVSINMQVNYKIGNLYEYVLQYDRPEEKLKAEAYRILLNETVSTNLDNLLRRNRFSFAKMVTQKLQKTSKQQKLGLEITNVALLGIHPPIEIAGNYQSVVSASIRKQALIIKAKSYANASVPKAEKKKSEMIKTSQVEALARIGQAYSESDLYLYQKRAYQLNAAAYKEWKWLEVLENGLKGKKIYLLDQRLNLGKGGIWLDMRQTTSAPESKANQGNDQVKSYGNDQSLEEAEDEEE